MIVQIGGDGFHLVRTVKRPSWKVKLDNKVSNWTEIYKDSFTSQRRPAGLGC